MIKPEIDWTIDDDAPLKEIKRLLGTAEALIENGRFVLTVESERQQRDNYLFHHFYPTAHSYEDTKLVGKGDVKSCIKALGEYVAKHQVQEKPYTPEQVAATIGLVLPKFDRRTILPAFRDNLERSTAKFIAAAGPDMEPYFREGWHGCVSKAKNPYPEGTHGDESHAWNEGWYAANRYLSA
jgi:hypothetical protein